MSAPRNDVTLCRSNLPQCEAVITGRHKRFLILAAIGFMILMGRLLSFGNSLNYDLPD